MNAFNPGPSFGEKLGSALAEALGATVEQKMQLNEAAREHRSALDALREIPEDASFNEQLTTMLEKKVPMQTALSLLSERSKAQERQAKAARQIGPANRQEQMFASNLEKSALSAESMKPVIQNLREVFSDKNYPNYLARKAGKIEGLQPALMGKANTLIKELVQLRGDVGKGTMTNAKLKVLLDAFPSAQDDPDTALSKLDTLEGIINEEINVADQLYELRQQYGGQLPPGYLSEIRKRLQQPEKTPLEQATQEPEPALKTDEILPKPVKPVQQIAPQQAEKITKDEGIESQEANAPIDVPIPSKTERLIDIVAPNLGAGVIGGPAELIKGLTKLIGFGADLVTGKQIGSSSEEIDRVFNENLSYLPQFDNTKRFIESYAEATRGKPLAQPETELEKSVAKYAQAFGEGAITGTGILNVMSQGLSDYAEKNGYGDFGKLAFSLMPFILRPSKGTKDIFKDVTKNPSKITTLPKDYFVSKKQNMANSLAKVLTKKQTRQNYLDLAEKLGFEPPIEAAKKGTVTGAVKKITEKVPGIGAPVMKETEATKKAIQQRLQQIAPTPVFGRTELGERITKDIKSYDAASKAKVRKAYSDVKLSPGYLPNTPVKVTNLSGDRGLIELLKKEVEGIPDPDKNRVLRTLNELDKLSSTEVRGITYKNRIPLSRLIELDKDFGDLSYNYRGTRHGRLLTQIHNRLKSALDDYGKLKPDFGNKYKEAKKIAREEFVNRERKLFENVKKLGSTEVNRPEAILDKINSASDVKLAKASLSPTNLKELKASKINELFSKGLTAEGNIKDQVLRVLKDPKKSEFYKELLGAQEYNDLLKFTEGLDQLKKNAAYLVNNSNTAEQQKIASMLTKIGTIAVGGKVAGVTAAQAIPLALGSYAANKFLTSPLFKKALIHLASMPKDPNRLAKWTKTSLQLLPLINNELRKAASDDLEDYVIDSLAKERSEKSERHDNLIKNFER